MLSLHSPPIPRQTKLVPAPDLEKSTFQIQIPSTSLVIEGKYWKNGRAMVLLLNPETGERKTLGHSLSQEQIKTLINFALIPHKEPYTLKAFHKKWKVVLIYISRIPL